MLTDCVKGLLIYSYQIWLAFLILDGRVRGLRYHNVCVCFLLHTHNKF